MTRTLPTPAAVRLLAVSLLVLAACGGEDIDPSPRDDSVSVAIVAAVGGVVSLPGGPTLVVPAGALAADATLTIRSARGSAPTGALSAVYEFGPAGLSLSHPATVGFPVPSNRTRVAIWTRPASGSTFHGLPTSWTGATASAAIRHLSDCVLGPEDHTGTWAGTLNVAQRLADGSVGRPGTLVQSRDVSQTVGRIASGLPTATAWRGRARAS